MILRNKDIIRLDNGDGGVLKMFEDTVFTEAEMTLEKGDLLLIPTDGISDLKLKNGDPFVPTTEHHNQSLTYHYDALKNILSELPEEDLHSATAIGNGIVAVCSKPKDDITIVVLGVS